MEPRVSLITLGVSDMKRARGFYEKLGFKASSVGGEEVVFFQAGGLALSLFPRESLACDANVPAVGGRAAVSRWRTMSAKGRMSRGSWPRPNARVVDW